MAIVDDVINAGSATRATLADLRACGARPIAVGALLVLGSGAADLTAAEGLALASVARVPNTLAARACRRHLGNRFDHGPTIAPDRSGSVAGAAARSAGTAESSRLADNA